MNYVKYLDGINYKFHLNAWNVKCNKTIYITNNRIKLTLLYIGEIRLIYLTIFSLPDNKGTPVKRKKKFHSYITGILNC